MRVAARPVLVNISWWELICAASCADHVWNGNTNNHVVGAALGVDHMDYYDTKRTIVIDWSAPLLAWIMLVMMSCAYLARQQHS